MCLSIKQLIKDAEHIFNTLIILSTGFFFGNQEFIPFILAYLYFLTKTKDKKKTKPFDSFQYVLLLILILSPLIIIINLLSGFILDGFIVQDVVISLKLKEDLSLKLLISLLVIAPLFEEFYFRGILINYFKDKFGPFWIVLLSSFYFSFIHYNIAASPTLFVLGILLGIVAFISNSIIYSIFIHMLFNSIMIFFIK